MSTLVYKQFLSEIRAPEGPTSRVREFIISTSSPDRDGDTIAASGWHLENFRKNPVVQWAHDYSALPIGKCTAIGVRGNQLVASAEFATHAFAETVLTLIDGGFLNATSVGFRPVKGTANAASGMDFTEQELLEFSIVPVPCNPEALVQRAASLGLSTSVFRKIFTTTDDGVEVLELRDDDEPAYRPHGKSGARHSAADRALIDVVHAAAVHLGAGCFARDEEPQDDDVVLDLLDPLEDPAARTRRHRGEMDIDRNDVRAALSSILPGLLDGLARDLPNFIEQETRSALGRARGRVD